MEVLVRFLKLNSNNDGLVYADDNNTEYTVVSPLTISNNAISLSNLTGFGALGQFLKVGANNTLVYGTDTDTTYSGGTNINISGTTINLDSTVSINRLNMNYTGDGLQDGNPIYFKGTTDEYHYIKFVRDGVRIAGYGDGGPCVQIYSTGDNNGASAEILAILLQRVD